MFEPSRDQVRDFFFETWRKYRAGLPLAGLETLCLDVILLHPEYHQFLTDINKNKSKDYTDEANPFLHMSLHLALEEQLSIDQPAGVAQRFAALLAKTGDRHDALHEALECLAEMVWRAQKDKNPAGCGVLSGLPEKKGGLALEVEVGLLGRRTRRPGRRFLSWSAGRPCPSSPDLPACPTCSPAAP